MPNKALRILIADQQHFHRMKIERLFNQLDYYRVAPVQSLGELLTLVEYGCEPFDLVVINASLAATALDLPVFFLDNPQVRHALIYDGQQAHLQSTPVSSAGSVRVIHEPLPDLPSIKRLMAIVDSRAVEDVPVWGSEDRQQKTG
jgi:hypothetical protein